MTEPERPRFSRWRRLPPVFRSGEHPPIRSGKDLARVILYLPEAILDQAELLGEKAGIPALQDYCEYLLRKAVEFESVRQKVTEFELRRGPLEGLNEVADDLDYLAEWKKANADSEAERTTTGNAPRRPRPTVDQPLGPPALPSLEQLTPIEIDLVLEQQETVEHDSNDNFQSDAGPTDHAAEIPRVHQVYSSPQQSSVVVLNEYSAEEVVLRHTGSTGDDWAFLPCLRRGEPVPAKRVRELIQALHELEQHRRNEPALERPLAHALHRLALESQVLLTDAWPGRFDARIIAAIRDVQESVERILSGKDIRYDAISPEPRPERSR